VSRRGDGGELTPGPQEAHRGSQFRREPPGRQPPLSFDHVDLAGEEGALGALDEFGVREIGGVMDEDGRGLTLVHELSREWGVTGSADGSKAVWASFPTTHG